HGYFLSGPGPKPNFTGPPEPGPILMNGSPPMYPSCWWSPVGSANLSGFPVPAAPSAIGRGLASVWLFMFTNSTNGTLAVSVIEGSASPYVTLPGGNCTMNYGLQSYGSIASGVID